MYTRLFAQTQKVIVLLLLVACQRVPNQIEPTVASPKHPKEIQREKRCFLALPEDFSVSPFPALTEEERLTDWGKEYQIALMFAQDFDLYRAITNFKRALCLMPSELHDRRLELQYHVALSYFLGQKYVEVVYTMQSTDIAKVDRDFPAYTDLLLILYESYTQLGKEDYAEHMLTLLCQEKPDEERKISLYRDLRSADFEVLSKREEVKPLLSGYAKEAKSVSAAQKLNALLPGAGYWYLGQKQTAITSVLVNSLFIGTAATFFAHNNIPAAILTLSFESGWYVGGIYGAGLAAKQYNEKLYSTYAERVNVREKSYPLMRLKYSF
ncbi:MAG: tetratricopeptide repeat protein [Chlamydiales bacterium]|nr:tetratricopeptide repeat protein [Chlamydiales bacterium]